MRWWWRESSFLLSDQALSQVGHLAQQSARLAPCPLFQRHPSIKRPFPFCLCEKRIMHS